MSARLPTKRFNYSLAFPATMGEIEVDIPTRLDTEIDQLVDGDEFLSRQEAIEELLSKGLQSYSATDAEEEEGDLAFADEMTNPGEKPMGPEGDEGNGRNDDYSF